MCIGEKKLFVFEKRSLQSKVHVSSKTHQMDAAVDRSFASHRTGSKSGMGEGDKRRHIEMRFNVKSR